MAAKGTKSKKSIQRKLTAILCADVVGYSRLMGADEEATIETLTAYREVFTSEIKKHRGSVVDAKGDAILAEFASVVDAVNCAVEIQRELAEQNKDLPDDRRMDFRIGINLGDVVVKDGVIYGDGVNIAARLEALAEPGGICISRPVFDQVDSKLDLECEFLGEQKVKNIAKPVWAYKVLPQPGTAAHGVVVAKKAPAMKWRKPALAAAILLVVAGAYLAWNEYKISAPTPVEAASSNGAGLPLPAKPSIAVLPFTNMSGDPEQEYFSDGITDDIITDLSKISGLFVIARNSTFAYKGRSVKAQQISRELGVRYMLEGSVRKSQGRVRITAQFIDATTGEHLWAERYDRPLNDVFALQDEISEKIVTALRIKLTMEEQIGKESAFPVSLEAYDLYLRGIKLEETTTKPGNLKAREMFVRVIEMDPEYAKAYLALGFTYFKEWALQWSDDPRILEQVYKFGQKCLELDPSNSECHGLIGKYHLWKKHHQEALAAIDKALVLSPNDAGAHADRAQILAFAGRPAEALVEIKKAMRLDPHFSFIFLWTLGHSHYLLRNYDEAIDALKKTLLHNPNFKPAYVFLAVIYFETGREEEGRRQVANVERLSYGAKPAHWKKRIPYKNQADMNRLNAVFCRPARGKLC